MVSLVAEIEQGPAEMNCQAAVPANEVAGRCGGGVPGQLQDGEGTDDRTGWPAVIRGHRQQYGKCSSQYQQCVFQWFLGKGVGCGRAYREVRQWGSKPEQMQDGRRGWLPKSGAVAGH
jgi:hypothetical protein